MLPVFIDAAAGGVLRDVDGNSLIDLGSGIAVTSVGNAAPEVQARVKQQVDRFTHTCFMVTPYEGYVEVCEQLATLTPGSHDKRSALFNSGAEAVENAVKIARSHTGRNAVAVFDHAYHGRTNLTMAMTAKNMPYKNGFGPFAPEVYRTDVVPLPRPGRDDWRAGRPTCHHRPGAAGRRGQPGGPRDRADPGRGRVRRPRPFLPSPQPLVRRERHRLRRRRSRRDSAGPDTGFACNDEGVVPDHHHGQRHRRRPTARGRHRSRSDHGRRTHLRSGRHLRRNPLACAAALGAIEAMHEHDLAVRAGVLADVMLGRLRDLQRRHAVIGDVRGRGAMIAAELTEPGTTTPRSTWPQPFPPRAIARVWSPTCGTFGNVLRLLPPLPIPVPLLEDALDVLDKALSSVAPS